MASQKPQAEDDRQPSRQPTQPSTRTSSAGSPDSPPQGKYQVPKEWEHLVQRVKFDPLAWKGLQGRKPK